MLHERTFCEERHKDTDRKDTMDAEQRGAQSVSLVTERLSKWTDTNSTSYKMNRSESVGILHFSFRDELLHVKGVLTLKQGERDVTSV